jgi:hypothetical protein
MDDKTQQFHLSVPGWKCNTCGQFITEVVEGWVEWLSSEDEQGNTKQRGLRLVHRLGTKPDESRDCQYDPQHEFRNDRSIVEGLSLERFVGADGLMLLLSLIAQSELPRDEILELTKRVQIPGYEQVREIYQAEISEGLLETSIGEGFYLQSEIGLLLRWANLGRHWTEQKAS